MGSEFLGSHRRLRMPSNIFKGFHRWGSCLTTTNGFFTRGGVYPCFLLLDTYFLLPFNITLQPCCTSSNSTGPTQSIIKRSIDFNHALTPIQCNVPKHMQCKASLHVISCHMYNVHGQHNPHHSAGVMDRSHHLHMTSILYFIHVNILCMYISTSTHNMSFDVQAMTHS